MENLLDMIEIGITIKIAIIIIVVAYFLILICKVWDIEKNTRDMYNNQLTELELLERIAKSLEDSDTEPYIIEKED